MSVSISANSHLLLHSEKVCSLINEICVIRIQCLPPIYFPEAHNTSKAAYSDQCVSYTTQDTKTKYVLVLAARICHIQGVEPTKSRLCCRA